MVWRVTTGRKIALIGAGVVCLFVVGLFGLHYYLRASAARYRAELVRKGEKLKISELLPTRVHPDSNGAPTLKMAAAQLPGGGKSSDLFSLSVGMKLAAPGRAVVGWRQSDLRTRTSDETNTWEELTEELLNSATALDEVRLALQQPEFDFNLNYLQGTTLPVQHLATLKLVTQRLKSSTLLHLHEQKLDLAFKDLQVLLALCAVQENERLMISQLVRMACMAIAVTATWEALQADGWSDAQLSDLQRRWETLRILEAWATSVVMERAMMLQAMDEARESAMAYQMYFSGVSAGGGSSSSDPLEAVGQGIRAALIGLQGVIWRSFSSYEDERRYLAIHQVIIEGSRKPPRERFYAPEQKQVKTALAQIGYREDHDEGDTSWRYWPGGPVPYNLAEMLAASSLKFESKAFATETQRDLAVVAIAIKRYQLRHGASPAGLEPLVPEFLAEVPRDRMDGKPLRYRVNPQAGFMLYSVGSDGIDNGGDGAKADGPSPTTPPNYWLSGKDWVWPQPASREEVEKYNTAMGEEIRKRWEQQQKSRKRKEGN